jgi:PIN domain nuclease of toxin-antitoxin system
VTSILLDTHAWVWWVTRPERLSPAQRRAIDQAVKHERGVVLLSIVSCWEVALLAEHRRLRFSVPVAAWLERATAMRGLQVVGLSLPIVVNGARLTGLRDPADMLIVATAQHHGARVVTGDERIVEADVVSVVT